MNEIDLNLPGDTLTTWRCTRQFVNEYGMSEYIRQVATKCETNEQDKHM